MNEIIKKEIKNNTKTINLIFSITLMIASLCFSSVGISSYLKQNMFLPLQYENILFFPQGLTMLIYGILGTILSISQLITLILNVGEGYNEFNKKNGIIEIFRKNYPGKNPYIKITYPITDILRNKNYLNKKTIYKLV